MLDNVKLFTVKDGDYENLIKTYVSSDKIVQDKVELIDVDFDEGRTIGEPTRIIMGVIPIQLMIKLNKLSFGC